MFWNGSTAMDGLSGIGSAFLISDEALLLLFARSDAA
jgi:hypothetical protein